MAVKMHYAATQVFSALTGKSISFMQRNPTFPTFGKQAYGEYLLDPSGSTRLVQADLLVLCTFGGALLGLPADAIKERAAAPTLDPAMADAVNEILNISSSVVSSEERAVFRKLYLDKVYLPDAASKLLVKPLYHFAFLVKLDDRDLGVFSVLANS